MATMTDEQMMRTPMEWPGWPCLPLKRYVTNQGTQFGFLLAVENVLTTVHIGSIFNIDTVNDAADGKSEHIDYPNVEAIVADGWQVD